MEQLPLFRKFQDSSLKCWLPAISSFPTIFPKAFFFMVKNTCNCVKSGRFLSQNESSQLSYLHNMQFLLLKYRSRNPNKPSEAEKMVWSGDASKNTTFGYTDANITISLNEEEKKKEPAKQQPVWMSHSTVDGVPMEASDMVRHV